MKKFRNGHEKNLYFTLLNNDSTRSSQIQLANIYDLKGNRVLIDELVLMDRKYEFKKFSSDTYAMIGKLKINETEFYIDKRLYPLKTF